VQGRQTLVLPPQGGRFAGEARQGRIALLHPARPGVWQEPLRLKCRIHPLTQLLQRHIAVRAIVRSADRLPAGVADDPLLEVVEADVLARDWFYRFTLPSGAVFGSGVYVIEIDAASDATGGYTVELNSP
jgi:hypothetical protein